MNKIASYLQEHISGEILTSAAARKYFSTDASILEVIPNFIVYPRDTADIRRVARFCWQLAEKGHRLPITARGRGTDLGGAAIGQGLMLVFPSHMNRILELDTKQKMVRVQPGMTFRAMQDVVETHGLFLPPYPASYDYSSVGGAVANNSAGEKTVKYGTMRNYVRSLEVVLANGDVIQTKRLSKRELNQKKGLQTLEGELYRTIDSLLIDNAALIAENEREMSGVTKRASGYSLADIRKSDGTFDLTPLIVGSQGTLGVVTEMILGLEPRATATTLCLVECADMDAAMSVINAARPMEPSAVEMVDVNLLNEVNTTNPSLLKGIVEQPYPGIVLFVEFDDANAKKQLHKARRLEKEVKNIATSIRYTEDPEQQELMWVVRRSAAAMMARSQGGKAALPFIEDAIVPPEKLKLLVDGLYALLKKYHLSIAVWGHAGDANLHVQPLMDLSQIGDRQQLLKLMNDYHTLVVKLGGNVSAEHNDGRLRTPYMELQHGQEMYQLFAEIKKLFDPYDILNPGVKFGTTLKDVVGKMRKSYSIEHLHDFLPYT